MGALLGYRGLLLNHAGASLPVGPADPYWSNVVSLLHFDGADGSTTFDDDAGRSWIAEGTAQIDTAQAGAFGGASGLFDGAGARISTPASVEFVFGTGDFTIEMRVRQVSPVSEWRELFMVNAGAGLNIMLYDGKLVVAREGIAIDYIAPAPVALGDWYHLAVSRADGVVYGFVNGTLAFSGAYGYDFNQWANVSIGAKSGGSNSLAGHIDELRVTKGLARYTSDYTPPTEPFPNS